MSMAESCWSLLSVSRKKVTHASAVDLFGVAGGSVPVARCPDLSGKKVSLQSAIGMAVHFKA